jgi:hypothetical protein
MGCLTRAVGAAVLLAGAATAAWWWTGGAVPLPEAIATRLPFEPRGADSLSTAPAKALARARWHPIEAADSRRAAARLDELRAPGGPGVVTLEPGDLVAFLVEPFAAQLPASARAAQVAVVDGRIYVKAEVRLEDLGGGPMLGSLVGMLDRRDTVVIGGDFELIEGRRGQFLVQDVVMGEFGVPRPLVPRLVRTIRRGAVPSGVAEHGYPVTLPPSIGDVRIRGDRISVYRAAGAGN